MCTEKTRVLENREVKLSDIQIHQMRFPLPGRVYGPEELGPRNFFASNNTPMTSVANFDRFDGRSNYAFSIIDDFEVFSALTK